MTDAVLQQIHLGGDLYVSPDARYLVVVEDDGNTISVNKILDDGERNKILKYKKPSYLLFMYESMTYLSLEQLTYFSTINSFWQKSLKLEHLRALFYI